jgi:hypothetical protein
MRCCRLRAAVHLHVLEGHATGTAMRETRRCKTFSSRERYLLYARERNSSHEA